MMLQAEYPQKNYVVAGEKELNFMKKNYIPKFDTYEVMRYLESDL